MTTADAKAAATRTAPRFRLPDPPERELDEVTALDQIYNRGMSDYLAHHFGNRETTLITADRWIVASPEDNKARARRPDLLIAFNVSPQIYRENNGYVSSEQGKPPDFVLEVASESTGDTDTGDKREDYARLGIPEYWRFDETGDHHKTRLAGDRLVEGRYEPIPIQHLPDGRLHGYSAALNLILEWHDALLNWIDPATDEHISTFETERQAKLQAESREGQERQAKLEAESREDQEREAKLEAEAREGQEREAKLEAEARNRELEDELRRLRQHEDHEPPTSAP